MAYDDIDIQTMMSESVSAENDTARGAETEGVPGVSYLAYVISSGTSTAVQTTYRVRICEMVNDLTEGAAFAGDWDNGDAAPREFLATNVGTARPGLAIGGNPGTLVIVHKVGERFAFDYSGG
jgi:hypothetical protein